MRRHSITTFVDAAAAVHDVKYDYSEVVYVNNSTLVKIMCRSCGGSFQMRPSHHLVGSGCPACWVNSITRTTEAFVERALASHGDAFDYSRCSYVNSQTKITIGCKSCGLWFQQIPNNHVRGVGCPNCSRRRGDHKRLAASAATFIERARLVHGDKYDYSNVVYKGNAASVSILCLSCKGVFEQSPGNHLAKKGCTNCATQRRARSRTKSKEMFVREAEAVYGLDVFDYSSTDYVKAHSPVFILCLKCYKPFSRTPASHLQGHACPYCSYGKSVSSSETTWLDSLGVPVRQHLIRLPSGRKTKVDGFDPRTSTVYAFLGSFWHADPRRCDPEADHPVIGKKNKLIFEDSLALLKEIEQAGFNVVAIWEEDWKKPATNSAW